MQNQKFQRRCALERRLVDIRAKFHDNGINGYWVTVVWNSQVWAF